MIKIRIIRKSNKKVGKRVNPTIYKHEIPFGDVYVKNQKTHCINQQILYNKPDYGVSLTLNITSASISMLKSRRDVRNTSRAKRNKKRLTNVLGNNTKLSLTWTVTNPLG